MFLFADATNLSPSVSYSWTGPNGFTSSLQNPVINSASAAAAGTYTVTASETGTCNYSSTSTVTITVNSLPALTPSSNSPICLGDTLHLTVNTISAATYHWTGPNSYTSNTQNPSIQPFLAADTGEYIITATKNGCHSTNTTHVSAKPLPAAPTASSNSPLCPGAALNLSASSSTSGVTYQWTGPNGFSTTTQNPGINPVLPVDSGNYIVKAILNGCKAADTIHVSVKPLAAAPAITNNGPLCLGDSLEITSYSTSSNVTYSWTGPGSFSSTNQNITKYNVGFSDSGNYYLTLALNGCNRYDTVHVSINAIPAAPTMSSNSPLCVGASLNLSASSSTPGVTYQWTGPNGFSTTIQNPVINPVVLADSGYYIVKAILNGCKSADTTHVTVKPLPAIPTTTNNSPICAGDTLKITSNSTTSGVSYSWTGPNSYSSTSQNITIPNSGTSNSGTYNLTVSLNACSVYASVIAVVNIVPATPTMGSNSPVCTNTSLNLTSNSTTPGVTYQWTGPNGFSVTTQNPIINPAIMADSGYYIVKVTLNGCHSADTMHVSIIQGPDSISFSSNSPVCSGNSLNVNSAASSGTTFSWTGPNSFSSLTSNFSIANTTLANSGDYYLALSKNGCIVHDTLHTLINQTPATPSVGSNSPVCVGSNLNLISSTSTSGVTYSWSGPNGFSSVSQNPVIGSVALANAGNYIVTVTRTGCSSKDSTQVNVITNPATPTAGNNGPICAGDTLKLNASDNTTGVTYTWSGPGSYSSSSQNSQILNAQTTRSGTYTVTASLNGCSSQANTTVLVNPVLGQPIATISVNPNDTVCTGTTLTFTASLSIGANPTYQWKVNGTDVTGATASTYTTSSLNSGDIVTCYLVSNAPCQALNTATSNAIKMHIGSVPAPIVTVSIYPAAYTPGAYVTYTAHVPNGGANLSYQWEKNGVPVSGAVYTTFTTSNLSINDTVCIVVNSTVPCTIPAVVCSGLTTGIESASISANSLQVYPNPNTGTFTIRGNVNAEKAHITLVNTLGQLMYSTEVSSPAGELNQQVDVYLPNGIYLLHITVGTETKNIPLLIKK